MAMHGAMQLPWIAAMDCCMLLTSTAAAAEPTPSGTTANRSHPWEDPPRLHPWLSAPAPAIALPALLRLSNSELALLTALLTSSAIGDDSAGEGGVPGGG
jgi:hypothetical protein